MNLRKERLKKQIKQNQLAKMVGVSREYIRLIENGLATNPNNELMKRVANILECSVEQLFFDKKTS